MREAIRAGAFVGGVAFALLGVLGTLSTLAVVCAVTCGLIAIFTYVPYTRGP